MDLTQIMASSCRQKILETLSKVKQTHIMDLVRNINSTYGQVNRNLKSGDILIFYRTGGYYKSVVTTLGIVQNVYNKINDDQQFIELCRKRSFFSDEELIQEWNRRPHLKPFIVNFLYTYSFPKRINLKRLIELRIIRDTSSAPRGFEEL